MACGDQVRRATVASVSEDRVEFALGEEIAAGTVVPITLLLAVFKFDRMEWAIEKCTELNVTTIVPVIARRTEKHLAIAAEKRVERWRRIAREASEQSRRIAPPEIADPIKLKDALEQIHQHAAPPSAVIPSEDFSPSRGICGPPRGGPAHRSRRKRARSGTRRNLAFSGRRLSHAWPLAPRAAGQKMSCRVSQPRNGSRPRWARRFSAPKPPPSPLWRLRAQRSSGQHSALSPWSASARSALIAVRRIADPSARSEVSAREPLSSLQD